MSGSGTVPHAAQQLNRIGLGFDVDPLSALLGRALCLAALPPDFKAVGEAVQEKARVIAGRPRYLEKRARKLSEEDQRFLGYWFSDQAALELFALTEALAQVATGPAAIPLAAMISSLIISRGSGASMAMDLSRSRPHRVSTKVPALPFAAWPRRLAEFARHYEARGDLHGRAVVKVGDARRLDVPKDSVDAIISSPPYLNAIDYLRASKFSLLFFGYDLAGLRAIRSTSVGTEVGLAEGGLPASLDVLVSRRVADPKRRPMLRRYLFDLLQTLNEAHRVLRVGGTALYVVGPSILSRRDYDGGDILAQIARAAGYRIIGQARRDLSPNNRSLPPPNRTARSQQINRRMTCELYVLLVKDDP
jgi:hypothetical protein